MNANVDIASIEDKLPEPLLQDLSNRFTIFPIVHEDIWNLYLTHKEAFWVVSDVDLTRDLKDWGKLTSEEQYFIKHILAFFAASDGIVNENLASRFYNEVQWAEVRAFYGFQINMETEHGIMYSTLIETYISDRKEKDKLLNAVQYIPAVKQKADWALKWIDSTADFAIRLIAFAIVEGIFFSGAFCSIYWINEKKIMPGLSLSNEYIARDEALHTLFAVMLYTKYIVNKVDDRTIYEMIAEAVAIEKNFINEALPCSLIGMNAVMMSQYIEFCADRLIAQLGYKELYGVDNPFPFMEGIGMAGLTNFFDKRSGDYKKKINKNGAPRKEKLEFTTDF